MIRIVYQVSSNSRYQGQVERERNSLTLMLVIMIAPSDGGFARKLSEQEPNHMLGATAAAS